jgi:hypothetical protein
MNLSVQARNVVGADVTLSSRYVHGYRFESAVNRGYVPTFATLGASMLRPLGQSITLLLQLDNLASCVGGTSVAPAVGISIAASATYIRDPSCGFGKRHMETPNMPRVGPMFIVGVRREWR